LGIINDLLDLSKIESGKMELLPAKYEIASLINDAVQLNMALIGDKPIEFNLQVDENMPSEFFGDELRIKQILNNLLSNAVKYTQAGEVVLSISAEYGSEDAYPDVTLVCRVSDTGPGMTAEQVGRLFDEYSRFDQKANRMIEGIGLGMHITRQLVHMMNGEIFVESAPGKGSIFTARLPQGRAGAGKLGRDLAENLRQCKANMLHMNMPSIAREPMPYGSVLIVDDLETNLYVCRGLMKPYDLSVDTALSGFAAIDKIRNGKEYDIVFMDHMMPGMDGMEATKILRGLGYARPIVALTANAVAGQAAIFLENGFDDFLAKPIDLRQLNALLNRLIRDKQPLEAIEAARRRKESAPHAGEIAPQASVDLQLASIFIHDAEKALMTLEAIHTNQYRRDDDFRMFVITVHAMKSALANIGEVEMAAAAASLEQAGRERDTAVMVAETRPFLDALRAVIEKIASKEEDEGSETADEDTAYLHEKLSSIQAACAAYDIEIADDALAELRQKAWSRQTRKQLDAIAWHLLNSEFEDAAKCCRTVLLE
ncbi:MAG: response regulator, partial [Deltaproteobacteria bacterium]|nr:response regulator [Deltaproteobacteria bacterium]